MSSRLAVSVLSFKIPLLALNPPCVAAASLPRCFPECYAPLTSSMTLLGYSCLGQVRVFKILTLFPRTAEPSALPRIKDSLSLCCWGEREREKKKRKKGFHEGFIISYQIYLYSKLSNNRSTTRVMRARRHSLSDATL